MFNVFKNEYAFSKSVQRKRDELFSEELRASLKLLIRKKFGSKLKIYIMDSGSCNGCELELQLLFSPYYSISSLGFEIVYEAQNADLLLITGILTHNMSPELEAILAKFKNTSNVVLIGNCPIGKAPFRDNFALNNRALELFPLAYFIEGCPPEPLNLLEGFHTFLEKYQNDT